LRQVTVNGGKPEGEGFCAPKSLHPGQQTA
jgi:hypothetical protein